MTNDKKLRLLEETLEMEDNSLTAESSLNNIEEFNSMAKLSLIVLCDDEFGKKLSGEQINAFRTVKDILDFMD